MQFPKNVDPSTIVWSAQPSHWVRIHIYLAWSGGAIVFFVLASMWQEIVGQVEFHESLAPVREWGGIAFLSLGGFFLLGLIYAWIDWGYRRYVLTADTLYTRKSWIAGTHDTMWVYMIRDAQAQRPLLQRVIGLGRVALWGLDQTHPEKVLPGLRGAESIAHRIDRMAREQAAQNRVVGIDSGAR